jgi:hypothetical protein
MSVVFYPNRDQMSKEVELCVKLNRLETLLSFCNSCMFKIFEFRFIRLCRACNVHHAITRVSKKDNAPERDDAELLGIC